ncbi:MAG: bifunctional phosphoribosyl-AMP cyclohydrolase/phosphoribosyl-ATP diphosphatase HisIE [Crocinitomicaceae bacterium]
MKLDFTKNDGLVPAIIQNTLNDQVLMLGYMNKEAFEQTKKENKVTFYSRSKQRLWIKGETSGNELKVDKLLVDCDNDTILIKVFPAGPTCHTGSTTCFNEESNKGFLYELENIIDERIMNNDRESYTYNLIKRGINKVAQKVGEEAVELVIEAKDQNISLFKNEAADLLYHFLILLQAKNVKLEEIEGVLKERNKK